MIVGDLTISYGGVDLAAVRGASISVSLELVSGAVDDGWETVAPRILGWSASASILQKITSGVRDSSQQTLEQHVFDKTRLEVTLTTPWGTYEGDVYITQMSVEASVGSAMSGSFEFTGAGVLTLTE